MNSKIQLILGGARSGKSRLAEQRASQLLTDGVVEQLIYVATAQGKDPEMQHRIAHHKMHRSADWQVVEEPWLLDEIITSQSEKTCVLIDCLTLWLTYGLCELGLAAVEKKKQQLIQSLQQTAAHVILVSNEVGHGIVPLGELSRQFVDQAGWLHLDLAALAGRVDFVIAGCTLALKQEQTR
ncbi:bifunctional adenosylcobinamide kinase/adenosylcobinamide-phosphate guanylyltransferase [Pseudoalteromonas sp. S16_S37]|uniref:bifunctional adenosylcobinamide kinase/adenosylcobinamide-phosphate guanylyltransferase n=1 Tax=Pseudoalteromonas sp. S16_S37 TaxID=2720228 RepID=UPI001681A739|nr:bifunctional adenosylcobinamide kinase/adenosylcobinamide-phosphate guanylyltransferase [Pseudoalteromonas sp. S16_S37]MBD1580838.1 bifunctional adenosylcobinamide kinase/adenosylcobinamide-phosphate guanylyltransferase [Pseudoalteromonas sp. S16_S37]